MKKAKKKEIRDSTVGKSSGPMMASPFPAEVSKRFLYKPFTLLPDLTDLIGKTIEVRVHKVYLTKFNKAVQLHQFYGNDNYSSDSDIVCILQHQGKINLSDQQPEGYEAVAVYFKVAKAKNSYPSQFKNGIKSQRKKQHYEGNSLKLEGVDFLASLGEEEELKAMAEIMPNKIENQIPIRRIIKQNQKKKIMVSKLADVAKKAVWPALVFNLSNEMAFKFNLCVFGDKSQDIQARTSFLTQKQVIYLETDSQRFEICRKVGSDKPPSASKSIEAASNAKNDGSSLFTFSRVLEPHFLDNQFFSLASTQVPLEPKYKEVIADDLDWHDFIWSEASLTVRTPEESMTLEPLTNFKLYEITFNNKATQPNALSQASASRGESAVKPKAISQSG